MVTFAMRPDTLERMARAVQEVEERLMRTCRALEAGGVNYAVIGGNAVAAWVSEKDVGAVRTTRDVDILIERKDLPAAIQAMTAAGFEYANVAGVDLFVDPANGLPSQGVHLLFAGERVRQGDEVPLPGMDETGRGTRFQLVSLEGLVRMKLTSFRRKDQVHLQDMARVGLIDDAWPDRFPPVLAKRLREILADPDG